VDLEEISKTIYAKLASQNEARDFLINEMHKVLKATREAIAAIHRNEIATAKESIKNAQSMIKTAQTHLKKLSQIPVVNLVQDAEGELAEAALLLAFRQNEALPSPGNIGVKEIGYLQKD